MKQKRNVGVVKYYHCEFIYCIDTMCIVRYNSAFGLICLSFYYIFFRFLLIFYHRIPSVIVFTWNETYSVYNRNWYYILYFTLQAASCIVLYKQCYIMCTVYREKNVVSRFDSNVFASVYFLLILLFFLSSKRRGEILLLIKICK